MPHVALGLCILWFVSLFVFRTALQWRQTGSTGIHGFHGRIGSPSWLAGVTVSLGLVLAPSAPLATLHGWPGGGLLFAQPLLHHAGAVLALLGIVGALRAQIAMGDSWRIGVDEAERTRLVTDGLFARVRNPIFSFFGLSLLGFVLVVPSIVSVSAGSLALLGIEIQVRAVEEPHLLSTHGEVYARYASRVGRFVPGLGRLSMTGSGAAADS